MPEGLQAATVIAVFIIGIYQTIKLISENRLKKRIIEKTDVNTEALQTFASVEKKEKYPVLKWGLVFLSAGISLVIMAVLNVDYESPLPYGIFMVAVSLGFLFYYVLVKREEKEEQS